jgi:hypothetical protein
LQLLQALVAYFVPDHHHLLFHLTSFAAPTQRGLSIRRIVTPSSPFQPALMFTTI